MLLTEHDTFLLSNYGGTMPVIERRRGIRVKQRRPVKLFEPGVGRYVAGRTLDVSSSGLRLEVPGRAALREGETVQVHIGTASGAGPLANRRRMLPARVVWVVHSRENLRPMLTAGLEFEQDIGAKTSAA